MRRTSPPQRRPACRTLAVPVLLAALALPLTACSAETGAAAQELPPPRGLTAQASSATSVHVMWTKATTTTASGGKASGGKAGEEGELAGYEIYRGRTRVKSVPADQYMVDITGLKPGTAYSFTARAKDTAGNRSPLSRKVTVTTRPRTTADHKPPTAPTKLRARASGARAATLSWGAAEDNEEITSYDIYQRDSKIHSVNGDSTAALVTGLRPGTDYTFTVKARDAADNISKPSEAAGLSTPEGPDDTGNTAPADFRVATHKDGDGAHYLDLSWRAPDTGGEVAEYQIHLNGKQATTLMWGAAAPEGRAKHSFFISRQTGQSYRVKLRAKLPDGNWGAFSAERTVVTGEG
ncbi:fibronectin type III domain-containing protein [Streptomyces monticola]|uniref:Fibronectin type III domain-containing protein n=1 Tax=Streptomyces monticola TaxID=2666263 RepID=A0ABW2JW80_9ACTN